MRSVEKTTFVPPKKKKKEYDRNLKDKSCEVYESVVTNWSELPAEQKSDKVC